jgi:hypothetical protein
LIASIITYGGDPENYNSVKKTLMSIEKKKRKNEAKGLQNLQMPDIARIRVNQIQSQGSSIYA